MWKCKTKANEANLGIFTHISAFSGIFKYPQANLGITRHIQELFRHIQAYSVLCVILAYAEHLEPWLIQIQRRIQNPSIFRNLTYSELWYIQKPDIFRTLVYSET